MLRSIVLAELRGGLWHTTHRDRYASILADGSILPEPGLPDSDRWKASEGREFWTYVRILGGVSLFDMSQFDPETYSQEYPLCSWTEFIPFRNDWEHAVWIEIDRAAVANSVILASDLLSRWKKEEACRHTIMPGLEAAHLGPLPITAFKRAFSVHLGDSHVRRMTFSWEPEEPEGQAP